jgi:glycosyltransferase involved in cell wall biosynthesis
VGAEIDAMRVVLLTAVNSWSGVEVHTIHLARFLKERGHDVVIVELGRRGYAEASQPSPCPVLHIDLGPDTPEGIPLESLGFGTWWRILGSLKADVAISVKGTFKFSSLAMEVACRLHFRRFMVIEHLHATLSNRAKGHIFKRLVPSLGLWRYHQKFSGYLRSVFPHKVICVSHAVADTLQNDYGYPPSKLIVAHSGVDTALFAPSPLLRNLARESWGIPETAFVFGTLGRLSPMKNHGQLINAFAQLCNCTGGRDIRLVIVGDGPLRTTLEALAQSTGMRERVVFAGFSETPQKIIPAFDVFCFPSTTGESFGIALLEAMSCECPPIASAVGGVPEIVDDPRLGWLIRSGDENDLLSAMRRAAELDAKSLQQLGANARGRVLAHFDAVDRWGKLVTVIESAAV